MSVTVRFVDEYEKHFVGMTNFYLYRKREMRMLESDFDKAIKDLLDNNK